MDAQYSIKKLKAMGLSDEQIARVCHCGREHINRVKQGLAHASQALTDELQETLQVLYENPDIVEEVTQRKPYTWRAGKDTRKKKRNFYAPTRRQPNTARQQEQVQWFTPRATYGTYVEDNY